MTLAVGIVAGLAAVSVPIKAYLGENIGNEKIQTQEWPFHDDINGVQTDKIRHWEPISGKVFVFVHSIKLTDKRCLLIRTVKRFV